jgi:hypothetical protein
MLCYFIDNIFRKNTQILISNQKMTIQERRNTYLLNNMKKSFGYAFIFSIFAGIIL